MKSMTAAEVLELLEKAFKDKPNYKKLLGGAGYRNGYEDGYKHALKRLKTFREEYAKQVSEGK